MDLASILPAPKYSFKTIQSSLANPSSLILSSTTKDPNANIPPYGSRSGYVPRDPEHFGDGGAFPEIHIKQYPLDMGRKNFSSLNSKGTIALHVNESGELSYDSILKQNMRKEQANLLQTKYSDLLPKNNITNNELLKPTNKEIEENTFETLKALEKITKTKLNKNRPTNRTLTGETGM